MQFQVIRGMSLHIVSGAAWSKFMWRVLAVLVVAVMLAHWTWVFVAPRAISVLPAPPSSSDSQAERLFGTATASAAQVHTILPGMRLVGVFAGAPGFAVFEVDGKGQMGLATGHEIVAGAKLVEVAFDHAVIERNGVRKQIPLAGKTVVPASPAALH